MIKDTGLKGGELTEIILDGFINLLKDFEKRGLSYSEAIEETSKQKKVLKIL